MNDIKAREDVSEAVPPTSTEEEVPYNATSKLEKTKALLAQVEELEANTLKLLEDARRHKKNLQQKIKKLSMEVGESYQPLTPEQIHGWALFFTIYFVGSIFLKILMVSNIQTLSIHILITVGSIALCLTTFQYITAVIQLDTLKDTKLRRSAFFNLSVLLLISFGVVMTVTSKSGNIFFSSSVLFCELCGILMLSWNLYKHPN